MSGPFDSASLASAAQAEHGGYTGVSLYQWNANPSKGGPVTGSSGSAGYVCKSNSGPWYITDSTPTTMKSGIAGLLTGVSASDISHTVDESVTGTWTLRMQIGGATTAQTTTELEAISSSQLSTLFGLTVSRVDASEVFNVFS